MDILKHSGEVKYQVALINGEMYLLFEKGLDPDTAINLAEVAKVVNKALILLEQEEEGLKDA